MKKINKADFYYIKWQKVTNNISDTELKYQINEINIIYPSYISCGFLKTYNFWWRRFKLLSKTDKYKKTTLSFI